MIRAISAVCFLALAGCGESKPQPTRTELIQRYEAELRELERISSEVSAVNATHDLQLKQAEQELNDHRQVYIHRYENEESVSLKDAEAAWQSSLKKFDLSKAEIEKNRVSALGPLKTKAEKQLGLLDVAERAKDASVDQ